MNIKIIIPRGLLELFSNMLDPKESSEKNGMFQKKHSALHLKEKGHDIYSNNISVEKSLSWFALYY